MGIFHLPFQSQHAPFSTLLCVLGVCGLHCWLSCPQASGWVELMLATSKSLGCKKGGRAAVCSFVYSDLRLCLVLLPSGGNRLAVSFLEDSSTLPVGCPLPAAASGTRCLPCCFRAQGQKVTPIVAVSWSCSPVGFLKPAHTFEGTPLINPSSITWLEYTICSLPGLHLTDAGKIITAQWENAEAVYQPPAEGRAGEKNMKAEVKHWTNDLGLEGVY